jgi:hypothetical protein
MSKKSKEDDKFQIEAEKVKQWIDDEWERYGIDGQTKRDANVWFNTLQHPGVPERGDIIRRMLCVLRYGGLFYRHLSELDMKKFHDEGHGKENGEDDEHLQWKPWYKTKWPICTALSHGGRVIIQLPKKTELSYKLESNSPFDFTFWRWLITGNPDGDLSKIVSTSTSGDQCTQQSRLLFKRLGATHGLTFEGKEQIVQGEDEDTDLMTTTMSPNSASQDEDLTYKPLPFGKKKVIVEQKTSGFNMRDTKMFRSDDHVLKHHRHWGMNIPLGGDKTKRQTGKAVAADGGNGHIYFYHMAGKANAFGGIMIGVEGSEWGKYDALGGYHGMSAKSSPYSPTFGYKWHASKHQSLEAMGGPGKYDCMMIDLSDGWEWIIEKYSKEWFDEYTMQTSMPTLEDPLYEQYMSGTLSLSMPKVITRSQLKGRTKRFRKYVVERAQEAKEKLQINDVQDYSWMSYKKHIVNRPPSSWPPPHLADQVKKNTRQRRAATNSARSKLYNELY